MKITSLLALTFALLVAAEALGAIKLNSSKSNAYREYPNASLTTASTQLGAGESAAVYNVPTRGDFILTQFCGSLDAPGGIRLDASGFGSLAQVGVMGCYTFTPGVSVPAGSTLSCNIGASAGTAAAATLPVAASYFCTISGMQTMK